MITFRGSLEKLRAPPVTFGFRKGVIVSSGFCCVQGQRVIPPFDQQDEIQQSETLAEVV